jgi:hypothetical protein
MWKSKYSYQAKISHRFAALENVNDDDDDDDDDDGDCDVGISGACEIITEYESFMHRIWAIMK